MKSTALLLTCSSLLLCATAKADVIPDILGTWQGTHENNDPSNHAYGQVNPMLFIVQSESGDSIGGEWDWLNGAAAGCQQDPCTTTWSGTINSSGQLSIVGQYGVDYVGSLSGNSISGTFTGPSSRPNSGYGVWSVTSAPEIDPTSAFSAVTLLLGGCFVLRGRRARQATQLLKV
jgi:hypothetical protein